MTYLPHRHARTLLFTAVATLSAGPAMAQALLEEVVVTAQKREATLSDTPIAITALTSEQLNALGIVNQQDIANFTPSMSYEENAGGGEGNRIYLRGIGRETSSAGTEPGVGVYDNGFYTNESGVLAGSVDRIDRIEILRGPQGTLYGRNTTGGAINVISKKPGDEFEHVVRGVVGDYSTTSLQLTSSGPITDKVGYLVHYSQLDQDSFYENLTGPDPRGIDTDYIEGQIDVDFTDNINWNLRYTSASFKNETLERAKLDGYRNEPDAPSRLGEIVINPELFAVLDEGPGQSDPFKISSDFRGEVAIDDQQVFQSTLSIDFDGVTVRMLNGYQDYTWNSAKDFDGLNSPASFVETIAQEEKNVQHELQFISNGDGDIDWVLGLFYLKNDNTQPYALTDAANPFLINNISGVENPDGIFYDQVGVLEATSMAIYSQVDWQVNERLSLSAGLRYSEDEKKASEEQQIFYDSALDSCGGGGADEFLPALRAGGDPYGIPAGCATRFGFQVSDLSAEHEETWDAVNWRLNASYEIGDDGLLFATVSTGYKPGGFRLGAMQDDPTTPENESVVDNEELTSYEIGYKGTIADKLSFSTAVFFYDYEDMQVELAILDANTGIATARLANAPKSEVYGFEFESTWLATEKLTLLANYSYLKSEYTEEFIVQDNKDGQLRDVQGNELNRTPNNKFTLAAYYVQPVGPGDVVLTANYSYIDDQYMTVFNDDIETVDSYQQVNARIAWKPDSAKYEVAVFGQNLTDELSYANAYGVSGEADGVRRSGRPINPRTYGLEAVVFF
ncbi:TonB-dependent receptor [Halieaceae bacterium IMCC14734]|uniref:TonB-dependent receptor n=1 Tax=Candidatus Litorirhabdus singularis TaxID=2518993 RepID=A0ABT3TJL5_9GAMM|nr:TonB-dependent receptor [Candidatus Litorirhabdus singularis]MCX2982510.1 TonB-dependent receptor [Candidatus Litorirhabdus singularis]